jgi:flagellar basal-body rod protein FlgB
MLNQGLKAIDLQKKALDASWLRQSVLSNNIANVNTPGYKRQDVEFESMLSDFLSSSKLMMSKTHPKHMDTHGIGEAHIYTETGTSLRIDGNNVNIDTEMAEIAKNSIKYNAMATDVNNQIRRLKAAIRTGR